MLGNVFSNRGWNSPFLSSSGRVYILGINAKKTPTCGLLHKKVRFETDHRVIRLLGMIRFTFAWNGLFIGNGPNYNPFINGTFYTTDPCIFLALYKPSWKGQLGNQKSVTATKRLYTVSLCHCNRWRGGLYLTYTSLQLTSRAAISAA